MAIMCSWSIGNRSNDKVSLSTGMNTEVCNYLLKHIGNEQF